MVADVAVAEDMQRVAERTAAEFGRIDTWINNAGVGLYGRIMDQSLDDLRRQFDVVYMERIARPDSPPSISSVGARLPAHVRDRPEVP